METVHYVLLVAGALATSLPGLGEALPPAAHPYIIAASAVCALVATVCGAISGKMQVGPGRTMSVSVTEADSAKKDEGAK